MTTKKIEEFLHAAFNLPVVADLGETYVEKAIAYRITRTRTATNSQGTQRQLVTMDVSLRAPNGMDMNGFIGAKLSQVVGESDCKVLQVSSLETPEYPSKTETIYTVTVFMAVTMPMNIKKERIKQINWS